MARVAKPKPKSKVAATGSRMPKRMKVGFRKYSIKSHKDVKGDAEDYYGVTIFERSEIRIKTDIGDDEKKATLFHEYCHARMHDAGLRDLFSAKQEEMICNFFAGAVMQLVRDNWDALEWAKLKESDANLKPFKVAAGENYKGEH